MSTDLVEIAKADVIERARTLTAETATFHPTALRVRLLIEELAAAVTLLTERERMVGEMAGDLSLKVQPQHDFTPHPYNSSKCGFVNDKGVVCGYPTTALAHQPNHP